MNGNVIGVQRLTECVNVLSNAAAQAPLPFAGHLQARKAAEELQVFINGLAGSARNERGQEDEGVLLNPNLQAPDMVRRD